MLWPWSMGRFESLLAAPAENDFITTTHAARRAQAHAAAGSHGEPAGSRTASGSAARVTVTEANSAETSAEVPHVETVVIS
jgi:hypothetical protein